MNKYSRQLENTRVFSSNSLFGRKFANFEMVAHRIDSQSLTFSGVPIAVILRCEMARFSL